MAVKKPLLRQKLYEVPGTTRSGKTQGQENVTPLVEPCPLVTAATREGSSPGWEPPPKASAQTCTR